MGDQSRAVWARIETPVCVGCEDGGVCLDRIDCARCKQWFMVPHKVETLVCPFCDPDPSLAITITKLGGKALIKESARCGDKLEMRDHKTGCAYLILFERDGNNGKPAV